MARRIVLMCAGLLVMAEGSVSLRCCRSVLANGSISVQLSEHPDPSCSIYVNADNVTVVDNWRQIDETRVLHYDPETLTVLLRRGMTVDFHIECDQSKEVRILLCLDLCVSSADTMTAASALEIGPPLNTARRIIVSPVLIPLLFIIRWCY